MSILFGCRNEHKDIVRETTIRAIFDDSVSNIFGSMANADIPFENFAKRYLPTVKDYSEINQLIYAAGLDYIETPIKDSELLLLRISEMPCFQFPRVIQFKVNKNKCKMQISFTDGDGCYSTGKLKFEYRSEIEIQKISKYIDSLCKLDIWNIKDDRGRIIDGTDFLLEVVKKCKYARVILRPGYGNKKESEQVIKLIRSIQSEVQLNDYIEFLHLMK